MKKIWTYIAIFFVGVSAGIIAGVKIMGDQVTVKVRKIKNKRISGTSDISIPISVNNAPDRRKRLTRGKLNGSYRRAARRELRNKNK